MGFIWLYWNVFNVFGQNEIIVKNNTRYSVDYQPILVIDDFQVELQK